MENAAESVVYCLEDAVELLKKPGSKLDGLKLHLMYTQVSNHSGCRCRAHTAVGAGHAMEQLNSRTEVRRANKSAEEISHAKCIDIIFDSDSMRWTMCIGWFSSLCVTYLLTFISLQMFAALVISFVLLPNPSFY